MLQVKTSTLANFTCCDKILSVKRLQNDDDDDDDDDDDCLLKNYDKHKASTN
jgi:hypothetical protein